MESSIYGMGWHRDTPDWRDYSPAQDDIAKLFQKSVALKPVKTGLPSSKDLSAFCSPIENQGSLGSCTAHAGVGVIEYFENRAFGEFLNASRLFLYKTTRNLLHWTGDTGAWLRTTMKAMVVFGVPPEEYWPYKISDFDNEPTAFCYSYAQSLQTIKYFRLDTPDLDVNALLTRVKNFLAAGYPSMFGFTVYNFGNEHGEFIFPEPGDGVKGGHAVVAVGYDDTRKIGKEKGALKIRNSWGTGWGEKGYGWLPYKYVLAGLAVDFWSVFGQEYLKTGKFE